MIIYVALLLLDYCGGCDFIFIRVYFIRVSSQVFSLNLFLKKPFYQPTYGKLLRVACKRRIHGFTDGLENIIETKVSETDVSKRISGQELTYKGKNERVIFSANQVILTLHGCILSFILQQCSNNYLFLNCF